MSENTEAYRDAALQGIREFLNVASNREIPAELINAVKMGTTVATNALLDRKGEATVLAVSAGLGDILEIGHQARPKTFALSIEKSPLLYQNVVEIEERIKFDGDVELPLNIESSRVAFQQAYDQGYRSIVIVLMHAYLYPAHEKLLANLATDIGFEQVSTSHEVRPLTKIVPRGETAVVDA